MSGVKRSQRRRIERTVFDPSDEEERVKRRKADNVEAKVENSEMRSCYDIIAQLMDYTIAIPFNEPVNWKELGLYSYPKIIKRPMDLGTIKTRLLQNKIKSIDKFAELVRLVFENSMLFNMEGSQIYNDAQFLLNEFETMFEKISKKPRPSANKVVEEEISYEPLPPPKNVDVTEEEIQEIQALSDNVAKLEKELEKTKKSYEDEKKKLSRLQRTKVKRIKLTTPRKPLTYEEKEILCQKITELDPSHLTMLLGIISSPQNDLENDEIEIDIENLDESTLLRVQAFVDKHLNSTPIESA